MATSLVCIFKYGGHYGYSCGATKRVAQRIVILYARCGSSFRHLGDYALSENQLEAAWRLQGWQEASHGAEISPASRSIFAVTQTETQQITLPAPPALAEKETELIGVP